ncbi:MAG: hypothetical protein HQK94_09085 [Nitrospirae bacterium]|nr:hypothetical protein [Nitrospirota bacterium]
MKTDFRYKMEHLGDYLVEMTDKVASSARVSAKGVILTYDIRQLKKMNKTLIVNLGKRIVELSKEDPSLNAGQDEKTRELLRAIDANEAKLNEFLEEREKRLNPSSKCLCHSTEHDVEESRLSEESFSSDESPEENVVPMEPEAGENVTADEPSDGGDEAEETVAVTQDLEHEDTVSGEVNES